MDSLEATPANHVCLSCGQPLVAMGASPQAWDEAMDDWLEGERASVRSRRFYGEPRHG